MLELEILKTFGDVDTESSFKKITTIRIGGKIKYLISPHTFEDLKNLLAYLKEKNAIFKVVGRGSNILASDKDYDGVVIRLNKLDNCYFQDEYAICEAGLSAVRLSTLAMNNGLSGIEFMSGIPGSMGGLVYMNAGAYKSEIKDVLDSVFVLKDNELVWLDASECDMSYRHSIFMENKDWIIIGCKLKLNKGDKEEIKELINDRLNRRKETQPINFPSCGSCFKNPENNFVWKLIDGIGLRGYRLNDIQVSEKHPNFIINNGNGKSEEFLSITNKIKKEVKEKYDIDLNLEVEIFEW